ncbi:MAG: hypothetical protein U0350_19095 [Caldilineaceae bacterium]
MSKKQEVKMSYRKLLQKALEVTLVTAFLVGCIAPIARPVSESPTVADTLEPLTNTPTPEPPTETPVPPTATSKPSYDGEWNGTTSQGKAISFTILNNGIVAVSVDFSFEFTSCGVSSISGPTSFWQQAPKASITESAFSVSVSERTTVTGLFSSDTSAAGSLIADVSDLGCKGTNEATWTATKQ